MRRGFTPGFVNYKKGALNSQPQVIKFTSCLASSSTKTGRHDITEILLKVALNTIKQTYVNKSTYKQSVRRSLSINQWCDLIA
jgi:hypothetical protein